MTHRHLTDTEAVKRGVDRPPDIATLTVVAVSFRRGEGCCDVDPVRMVTAYFSMEGELLAESDTLSLLPASATESATDGGTR